MDFSAFDDLLDSAELDPRPRMKKAVREILKFEMQHVPAAIAAEMTSSRLKTLGKALVEIIEDRDTRKWFDVVYDLRDELRRAIARERESGRLQPWSAESQIKTNMASFARWAYHSRLIDYLRSQLENNETIIAVKPREVVTSRRTWTRADLQAGCRFVTERSDSKFAANFISDAQLDVLIEDEAKHANPRPLWADANDSVMRTQ